MMRGLRYHARVQDEVREILGFYSEISDQLADDFWKELSEAADYARQFPERHHFDASGRRRSNLSRFPYHFLFRVSPSLIKITVVRHNSRSPGYGDRRR
jgi:plasmid stabilization system protein ParE